MINTDKPLESLKQNYMQHKEKNLMRKLFKSLFIIGLISFIFLFASCDGEVKMNLYTTDLLEAMETEEIVYVKTSMIVEGMSESYDYQFLEDLIPSFSNPHYVEYDYQTSLAFDIKIPIIKKSNLENYDHSGNLFEIVGVQTKSGYSFYFNINKILINQINSYTTSTMYQSFKLSDFDFSYDLINDCKDNKSYKSYSSYVNNNAHPMSHSFELERRDSKTIKLSEVLSKSLEQDEKTYFLTIDK